MQNIHKNPKISIIVASYNYQDYIKETLDSLLAQTYKNFEVIVVDDGSADDSCSIIQHYADMHKNIFFYQHEQGINKGLTQTVKLGIEKSTGEYIAFCESDDYWTSDHLAEKINCINEYNKPNIIVNDLQLFGDSGRFAETEQEIILRKKLLKKECKISMQNFREVNYIMTFSCCMVNADVLKQCNFDKNNRQTAIDWWLWRQVCCNNSIYYINKKLTYWRIHRSFNTKHTDIHLHNRFKIKGDMLLFKKRPFAVCIMYFCIFSEKFKRLKNVPYKVKQLIFKYFL